MEDKKLSARFKGLVQKTEAEGYPPVVVRESFDRVASPLPWQHNWLILFILVAGVLFGLLVTPLIILGNLFVKGDLFYAGAFFLVGSAGFLFYFGLSAFNIHEWAKLLFTFFASAVVATVAFTGCRALTALLAPLRAQLEQLNAVSQAAAQAGMPIGASLLTAIDFEPISASALIAIILLSYNLWPLLFWVKDKIQSRRKAEKKA